LAFFVFSFSLSPPLLPSFPTRRSSDLPFFHSFGFTGTLCLPAATGIGVVFHPNPLDSRVIGALIRKYSVTMLLATPTFLNAYTRDRKSRRLNSSHLGISYAVFCLKKKK